MALRGDGVPPILRDMARGLRVSVRGNEVTISFEYDIEDLLRGLEALEGF